MLETLPAESRPDGRLPCSGMPAPVILPLLVTDNIEGAIHGHTTENVRQLLGAVVLLSNNFGGSATAKFRTDLLRSVLGRDLNSLLTVGRLNDNTLRVRLGAVQSPTGSYAMVPQTHNVTVLMMVPKREARSAECRDVNAVRFVSKTFFVDAKTGVALPERGPSTERALLRKVNDSLESYGVMIRWSPLQEVRAQYLNMVLFAATNNRQGFHWQFHKLLTSEKRNACNEPEKASLFRPCLSDFTRDIVEDGVWMELVNLTSGSPWHIGTVEFPEVEEPRLPPMQTVLLFDDATKKTATVTIIGGKQLRKDAIEATLRISTKEGAFHELRPLLVDVPATGDAMKLTFVTPSKLFKSSDDAKDAKYTLSVGIPKNPRFPFDGVSHRDAIVFDECCLRFVPADKETPPEPPVKMMISSSEIRAVEGDGKLSIEFERDAAAKDVVRFDISGADIAEMTAVPATMFAANKPPRTIASSGVVTLTLRNLSHANKVRVTLKKVEKSAATPIGEPVVLDVRESQPQPERKEGAGS